MNSPTRFLLGLGLAAFAALPAPGAIPPSPAAEEPVRLYTNADLDRLGPAAPTSATRSAAPGPTAAGPSYAGAPADWEFVNAWLEREYARLDAAIGREQRGMPYQPVGTDEPTRYGLALAPYANGYGYGYGYGNGLGWDAGFGFRPGFGDRFGFVGRPGHGSSDGRPGGAPPRPRPHTPRHQGPRPKSSR